MFCPSCGEKNEDAARFCQRCGTALPAPARPARKKPPLWVFALAAALVLTAGLLLPRLAGTSSGGSGGGSGGGSSSGKSTADKAVLAALNALFYGSSRELAGLYCDEVLEDCCRQRDLTRSELLERFSDHTNGVQESMDELFPGWRISFEVVEVWDYPDSTFQRLARDYERQCGLELTGAQMVTVDITCRYDGRDETSQVQIVAVQVEKRWYIDVYRSYLNLDNRMFGNY